VSRLSTALAVVALSATAAVPTAALAGATPVVKLQGSPQMFVVDAHHATLKFAARRIHKTASGGLGVTIAYAGGQRVTNVRATGTHGTDIVYSATVASKTALKAGTKYTVSFRFAGGTGKADRRAVKLYASR